MRKRIFSFLLSFVLAFSCLIPPANAVSFPDFSLDLSDVTDFFDWCLDAAWHGSQFIVGTFADEVCKLAPGYNARHNFVEQRTTVDGKTGLYYICEYCGKSAGEVGQEAYNEYVSELPATSYNSAGRLIWQPAFSNAVIKNYFGSDIGVGQSKFSPFDSHVSLTAVSNGFNCSFLVSEVMSSSGVSSSFYFSVGMFFSNLPVNGTYILTNTSTFSGGSGVQGTVSSRLVRGNGEVNTSLLRFGSLSATHLTTESTIFVQTHCGPRIYSSDTYFSASFVFPIFEIIPDSTIDFSGGQYAVNTRPTTITGGNYGIVGDDGTLNVVTNNNQIVNETNNTYYNPSTGQTSTITDWSYNYENRTYDITLDTGDRVSVKYGDQNITIKEGDITYTIYYIVNGSGSIDPGPTPSACAHDWQETSRKDPTCTLPGKVTSVCSVCGEPKTEILPALDHDWQVWRTVLTQYDENGDLIQEGYTIYECSRCGEQWKDGDNTGPPDDSTDDGGLLEFLNGIIKHLSDNLSGAVDLILRFFREIPKMFGGFLDFLSAMFPYLPEEIIFLLTFGIAALVIIGVIKAIRR